MLQPSVFESSLTYGFVEMVRTNLIPFRNSVKFLKDWNVHPLNPISYLSAARSFNASLELAERITRNYPKPKFGINSIKINDKLVEVKQETIMSRSFCNLLHFKKKDVEGQKKLLILAPMSGHYATLCRGTVEGILPHFDVYITDWQNARDIPLSAGKFDLDDFIDYCIDFFIKLGPNLNVMAICQPSVACSAAVAIMSREGMPFIPNTMTLIGGPIDTRKSPTKVNNYAEQRPVHWFENNVITRVTPNYPGYMRAVYPGFIQLSGFMAMNMQRHVGEHIKLFNHLIEGDGDNSEAHRKFYDEFLAVMDLPAEFYLQTIGVVFQERSLPKGELVSKGRQVNLADIKNTSLLVIEGEKDDITGLGQTEAAIDLCKNIPKTRKQYYLQKGVGHYGIFNGCKYKSEIVPVIKKFIDKHT